MFASFQSVSTCPSCKDFLNISVIGFFLFRLKFLTIILGEDYLALGTWMHLVALYVFLPFPF